MTTTRNRVPAHTREEINNRIRRTTERRSALFPASSRGDSGAASRARRGVGHRTGDRGERVRFGLCRGGARRKPEQTLAQLPALVSAFLFQHAVQGWCPPIPVLRRLGFRTAYEIEEERQALKAIRGDYRNVRPGDDRSVLLAVRA